MLRQGGLQDPFKDNESFKNMFAPILNPMTDELPPFQLLPLQELKFEQSEQAIKEGKSTTKPKRRKKPRLQEGMTSYIDEQGRMSIVPQGYIPVALTDLIKMKIRPP